MEVSNSVVEYSASDNSHIFGIPFRVVEGIEAYMLISREDVREWVDKVAPLGIEFHFGYKD